MWLARNLAHPSPGGSYLELFSTRLQISSGVSRGHTMPSAFLNLSFKRDTFSISPITRDPFITITFSRGPAATFEITRSLPSLSIISITSLKHSSGSSRASRPNSLPTLIKSRVASPFWWAYCNSIQPFTKASFVISSPLFFWRWLSWWLDCSPVPRIIRIAQTSRSVSFRNDLSQFGLSLLKLLDMAQPRHFASIPSVIEVELIHAHSSITRLDFVT